MKRPSNALMVILYSAAAAVAILTALQPAQAAEPPIAYDPARSIKQGQFLQLYARTATCMRQATVAILRQGVREQFPIRSFVVGTCGGNLRVWLVTQDGYSQAEVETLLNHMAGRALEAATQPPSHIFIL